MLAMVRNPDVLRRAREEIDNVVGSSRLPEFADRDNLPYLNALVEEVYRYVNSRFWSSVHSIRSCTAGIQGFLSVCVLDQRLSAAFVEVQSQAIPHRAMSDDEYRGYNIPKGCMIMPNIWSVTIPFISGSRGQCIEPFFFLYGNIS